MSKPIVVVSKSKLDKINHGKRRKLQLFNWQKEEAKRNKNEGKPYLSQNGSLNPPKLPPDENIICLERCGKEGCRIGIDRKIAIFTQYWETGSYNEQTLILSRNMRKVTGNTENERQLYAYYLPNDIGIQLPVCQRTFIRVFGISKKRIEVLQRKISSGRLTFTDTRGDQANPRRLTDNGWNAILAHMHSYETSCSHYSRNDGDPVRQYLPRDLSVARMFRDFVDMGGEDAENWEWAYRACFKEIGLKFASLKTDTCTSCDRYDSQIRNHVGTEIELEELWTGFTEHHLLSEDAYASLRTDTENSRNDPSQITLCVDLQGILQCPRLTNSDYYYQRKYTCYNLCITKPDTDDNIMSFWHQIEASRGSSEVASCIYRYCMENYEILGNGQNRTLTVYSDRCVGQNNNFIVLVMYMQLIRQNRFTEVHQKFMTTGHSFLPCDRQFSIIEKKMRLATIQQPDDYINVIENARLIRPFVVQRMHRMDFLNFMELMQLVRRPRTLKGTEIMCARLTNNPNVMFTEGSHWDVDWTEHLVNFNENYFTHPLNLLYPQPLPIPIALRRDLRAMLPFLSSISREFWTILDDNNEVVP